MLRKKAGILILIFIFMLVIVGCDTTSDEPENQKVAIVNGEPILQTELNEMIDEVKGYYMQQGMDLDAQENNEVLEQLKHQVLQEMIQEKIILEEVQKKNLTVDNEFIKTNIDQLKNQLGVESDEEFNQQLDAHGTDREEIEKQLETQYLVDKYYDLNIEQPQVSDEEVKQVYNMLKEEHGDEVGTLEEETSHIKSMIQQQEFEQQKQVFMQELMEENEVEILL
ncbi:hypothetical protein SYNTR_0776 [Candidatus Syntrophocurvum alkaliphilum]|uniref:SurA N-terminal domain-containing protein n=1 Tax=Candidatus Syntrophocurvum alkaliphilum TaxID=2293317 RepID=A0A6I6DAG7_9FIRM|nr:SurA N-terminal domain-containing protein [Candidatus Syntrophocurvum alkaliphilum]QGT99369.1 hypothetical protein SYNTR_0776 [Candidatus Syntrophocurvum alkaliphilum]